MAPKSKSMLSDYLGPPPWAQAIGGQAAQSILTAQTINGNPIPQTVLGDLLDSELHRQKLIAMRLRIREGEKLPYQNLFTSLAGDKVFVFVVQDNQAVTLEDDATMFPSDQLITQLRLLDK